MGGFWEGGIGDIADEPGFEGSAWSIRDRLSPGAEERVGEDAREGGGRTCFLRALSRMSRRSCANWRPGTDDQLLLALPTRRYFESTGATIGVCRAGQVELTIR